MASIDAGVNRRYLALPKPDETSDGRTSRIAAPFFMLIAKTITDEEFKSSRSGLDVYEAYLQGKVRAPAENPVEQKPIETEPPLHSATTDPNAFHHRKTPLRPGTRPDGSPATKQYLVGIQKSDIECLREQSDSQKISISKLVLGYGLGSRNTAARTAGIKPCGKQWTTVSISINDVEWDSLVFNASLATWPKNNPPPAQPDPPAFCLLAALGVVKLPDPAPVALSEEEQDLMQSMYRATWLARIWNPWLLPCPDAAELETAVSEANRCIEKLKLDDLDRARGKKLDGYIIELRSRHDRGQRAGNLWEGVLKQIKSIAN